MLGALSLSLALLPSATAVLAVAGDHDATIEAQQIRYRLIASGEEVLADTELKARLFPLDAGRRDTAFEEAERVMASAERLAAEGELEAAAAQLEQAVAALDGAPSPTEASAALEERLRMQAANWRLGLAGPEETGRGESPEGRAALQLLTEALVRHPTLALDAARYPPRMRRLLEQARVELSEVGLGELRVTSSTSGARVFVDGRALGTTPLDVAGALPLGRHRLWLEQDGGRSATRDVVLTDDKAVIDVDVAFEASVRSSLPAIAAGAEVPLTHARRVRLATVVDADEVVMVARTGDALEAARFDRSGEILAEARAADLEALLAALAAGSRRPDPPAFIGAEPVAVSDARAPDDAEAEGGDASWWWIGGGAAAAGGAVVVVGAAGAAAIAAVVLMNGNPPPATGAFTVTVTP